MFQSTSEFLTQDNNSIHKKSHRRMADKIVVFNEHTIQAYVEKTKKWSHFKYLCDKSKAVAYEDRWMEKINYFSLVFSDGYLSGVSCDTNSLRSLSLSMFPTGEKSAIDDETNDYGKYIASKVESVKNDVKNKGESMDRRR